MRGEEKTISYGTMIFVQTLFFGRSWDRSQRSGVDGEGGD